MTVPQRQIPAPPTFYAEVGGHETFHRLVARFYDDTEGPSEQRGRVAWPDAENLSAPDERQIRIGDILANLPRAKSRDEPHLF